MLKRVEVCCSNSYHTLRSVSSDSMVQRVSMCCSVLQSFAVSVSTRQLVYTSQCQTWGFIRGAGWYCLLQCAVVCSSVLQQQLVYASYCQRR